MSLTYGFYNSLNHDRLYSAIQLSSIFDGIIIDGIFMTIGDRFNVTASGNDMFVIVGTGRAWFDHTWTLNDALLPIEIPQSELILNRYDAVVLEVNSEQSIRANNIKVVKGTPASKPSYPALTNSKTIHQHVLAYVYVAANVTSIRQANITSMVGTNSTPYVTGPLKTISIESMVKQWEDEWRAFFEKETADITATNASWKKQWEDFYDSQTADMTEASTSWKNQWDAFYKDQTSSMESEHTFWKNQWTSWYTSQTQEIQNAYTNWEKQWTTFYNTHVNDITETAEYWKEMWQKWFYDYVNKSSAELAYWKELLKGDFTEYTTFWKDQWRNWYESQTQTIQNAYISWENQWSEWYLKQTTEMEEANEYWKTMWQTWFYNYVNESTDDFSTWKNNIEQEFVEWWESIKGLLDDPTAEFAEELLELTERVTSLEDFRSQFLNDQTIYDVAEDSDGEEVLDGTGEVIIFRKLVFVTEGNGNLVEEVEELKRRIKELEAIVSKFVAS